MRETVSTELPGTPEFRRLLQQCVHCGFCLQACPTYAVYGTEMESPRGRIALMRAVAEGRVAPDRAFEKHIRLCLACRACETACPSGVQYGALVEIARGLVEEVRRPGGVERFARWLAFSQLLPHVGRLRSLARLLRFYRRAQLQRLVRAIGILPGPLKAADAFLPPLSGHPLDYGRPFAAAPPRKGAVAFFHGCVQEAFLSGVNAATVRVLQRNGYDVHVPPSQTCCGAAPLHVGQMDTARQMARRNIDAFANGDVDAIVNNAGGCGAMLKEYGRLLEGDPAYADKARSFSSKVRDISEFLIEHMDRPPTGVVSARVTYADSCHLRHAQRVVRQPRDLLAAIPGLELIELKQPDRCCGSAGVYNIMETETSNVILDAKMSDIGATGADTIVTTNAGCYMQLMYGVRKSGLSCRVVHLIELLDQSYEAQARPG